MAEADDFEKLKLRLHTANALALANDLLTVALAAEPDRPGGQMLKLELELVLRHARDFAGLNPDGTFDKLPRPPAPKGGRK